MTLIRAEIERYGEVGVRQLNLFLKRIGLKLAPAKTEKVAGRKIRYYAIPSDLLGTMMRLSRSYLDVKARKEAEKEERVF